MELNNNPFYELRSRLYASAAAGCSIISEDFRLQRAIDAFKPMSETNKVFGRLYSMCCDLLKSDNPASSITDCIALADALAVTQGTFVDTSETKPANKIEKIKPQNIPYSRLREYISKIQKCTTAHQDFSADILSAVKDPRILSVYLDFSGSNSAFDDELSQIFEAVYGDSLIQPLIDAIDFSNEKASGKQITYIYRIAGESRNDLYVELAENSENPQNVRIRAIEAMACSESNIERLVTLYQTEKGKIKTAALISLAKLNAEEAEPILSKMLAKYKSTYTDIIAASGGKVCTEFVRKAVDYAVINDYDPNDKNTPVVPHIAHMLENKKDVTDSYLKLAEYCTGNKFQRNGVIREINTSLSENIFFHEDVEYRDMIFDLYEKYPDIFFTSRFYLELITDPMNAFTVMIEDLKRYYEQVLNIINNIYTDAEGVYRLPCAAPYKPSRAFNSVLFKNLPDNLLDFLADTEIIEKYAGSLLLENAKHRDTAQMSQDKCVAFIMLAKICNPKDRSRVKAAAEKLAKVVSETFPNSYAISILGQSTNIPLDGIVQRFVEYSLNSTNKVVSYYVLNSLDIPSELLISELKALAEKLPKMGEGIKETTLKSQLREIERALAKYGIDLKKES